MENIFGNLVILFDLFICYWHITWAENYKKCTGYKDEQAYNAKYKTTQYINIV